MHCPPHPVANPEENLAWPMEREAIRLSTPPNGAMLAPSLVATARALVHRSRLAFVGLG
jgi:hypothetical protein